MAAVALLRERIPQLRIRVVNVVDLMRLESSDQHPHGLDDRSFDALFTLSKPVIFAFHGYPSLVHRLVYRRMNHAGFHVHGYREEGTITTPFDMTVRNELDRFHLAMHAVRRLPQSGNQGIALVAELEEKLREHRRHIEREGEDMPEVRGWKWPAAAPAAP
jgi:xylulose-5-phosphate/fructose-6-phosphate phosphoketolase